MYFQWTALKNTKIVVINNYKLLHQCVYGSGSLLQNYTNPTFEKKSDPSRGSLRAPNKYLNLVK